MWESSFSNSMALEWMHSNISSDFDCAFATSVCAKSRDFLTSLFGGGDFGGVGGVDRGSWTLTSIPAILSYFRDAAADAWLQHIASSPAVAAFFIVGLLWS